MRWSSDLFAVLMSSNKKKISTFCRTNPPSTTSSHKHTLFFTAAGSCYGQSGRGLALEQRQSCGRGVSDALIRKFFCSAEAAGLCGYLTHLVKCLQKSGVDCGNLCYGLCADSSNQIHRVIWWQYMLYLAFFFLSAAKNILKKKKNQSAVLETSSLRA